MLNPRIIERGPITLIGITATGQLGEINYAEVWAKQYAPMEAFLRPLAIENGSFGASFAEKGQSTYLAGVVVIDSATAPAGTEKRMIAAAMYAVFDSTLATMADTVQQAFGDWFHTAGMEPDPNGVMFEHYIADSETGEMRVEIYIPVKEKAEKPLAENGKDLGVFDVIASRRSIRNYKNIPIQVDDLRKIIQSGILAPSGMNRQPWKFYVIRGEKRDEMITHLSEGLKNREKEGGDTSGAHHSFDVMAQAPVTVFIYRANRTSPWLAASMDQHYRDLVDVQSIGAAIENMILTAEDMGIGSLWVCDVFSANQEISDWLGESTEMIAAVCFGYADEHPVARKRRSAEETIIWL